LDIKVNQALPVQQVDNQTAAGPTEGGFKFMLASQISDTALQEQLSTMLTEITEEGQKIAKRRDVRDMKHYRGLIKGFLNEIVNRSHKFSRENFLDRRGRHRVYGIIRRIDATLDEIAQALVSDERDNIDILAKIGEIQGLILDIFT